MKNRILIVTIVLLWLASCLTDKEVTRQVSTLDTVVNATEQVLIDYGMRTGTSFHIGDGYFISAAHVMSTDGHESLLVGGHEAIIVDCDHELDIVLLYCEELQYNDKIIFTDDPLEVLDPLLTIGWHYSQQFAVSPGNISAYEPEDTHFVNSAPANPGVSGGPIVNEEFELIGITVMIMSNVGGFQGITLALHSDQVLNFVRNHYEPKDY